MTENGGIRAPSTPGDSGTTEQNDDTGKRIVTGRAIKRILQIRGLNGVARRLNRRRPAILIYHGLVADRSSHEWTQVPRDDFAGQMKYLKEKFTPVSLERLVNMLETGDIAPHTVAVTFDDGYKSNLDLALPVLKKYDIPATIFVSSGFVLAETGERSFLWPDWVTMIFLSHRKGSLDLTGIGAGRYEFSSTSDRYRARDQLVEQLKSIPDRKRRTIMQILTATFREQIDFRDFTRYLPLSPAEVRCLADEELISIGAHSRSHSILSRVDDDDLEAEIIGCKKDLEDMTDTEITQFAYPNGRRCDIDRRAVRIVSGHYRAAVMTESGLVRAGDNKYLLRRIGIGGNLSQTRFAALLSGIQFVGQKPVHDL